MLILIWDKAARHQSIAYNLHLHSQRRRTTHPVFFHYIGQWAQSGLKLAAQQKNRKRREGKCAKKASLDPGSTYSSHRRNKDEHQYIRHNDKQQHSDVLQLNLPGSNTRWTEPPL